MLKKLVKKIALAATLACMATTVVAATACNSETKHPKVRITVEFNGTPYDLDYTLYRNMYPNTVRHFIELAESGIYNDMLIHDYRANDWLTGGFAYNAEEYAVAADSNADNPFADYFENNSLESSYMELFAAGKLTPTVYSGSAYDENDNQILVNDSALPTLIGEFYNNIKQEIVNGELVAEQGTLKMYYYGKETTNKVHVKPTDSQIIWNADYKKNCATSVFAMQVGNSSNIGATNYCVFGKMDSTTDLDELINVIDKYYENNDAVSITVKNVNVDNLVETFSSEAADRGMSVDFTLPSIPLIVRSVKVTKH